MHLEVRSVSPAPASRRLGIFRIALQRFNFAFIPVACLAVFLLSGCRREKTDPSADAPVRVEQGQDASLIQVQHPEQFPLVNAETRKEPEVLSVNGVVAPDISRTVHINSLAGGRVMEIRTRLGDEVHQGQVVLVLQSNDLTQAFSDYKKFVSDEALARKSLDRAQELFTHGALAQRDLDQAEDAEQKSKVDVQTASDRIHLLGGDVNHPSAIIAVRSPISGTVVEQNTSGGEAVKSLDNSPSLFTIADLSRVWVLCDVYENDLGNVRVGDTASVRFNAYPDKSFAGPVSNISRVLDPATRTAKVRVAFENRGGLLRPGMFATVSFTSRTSRERLLVPSPAVLRLHDKYWVFRPEGAQRFRRVEVHAGLTTADGFQEVLSGLEPGDRVVANALQFSSSVEQ